MAYASQKPWLLNATVVENITFEMPMIKSRSELPLTMRPSQEGPESDEAEIILRRCIGPPPSLLPSFHPCASAASGSSLNIPSP